MPSKKYNQKGGRVTSPLNILVKIREDISMLDHHNLILQTLLMVSIDPHPEELLSDKTFQVLISVPLIVVFKLEEDM